MVRELVVLCSILVLIVLCLVLLGAVALGSDDPQLDLVITEFMAVNDSTLADQDGDHSDWIEIHNRAAADVSLGGWYLTDNARNLTKWRFPDIDVAANDYLVVFASRKDRAVAGSELHTNFRLDSHGEYLALVQSDGKTVAWEVVADGRLAQFADVSYGLDTALNDRYLTVPTPGMVNGRVPADLGPILSSTSHAPLFPTTDAPIIVTATVTQSTLPVDAVTLHYRVMYGDTIAVPMLDDGGMGDGIYGAVIPHDAYQSGEMVRYYVTATDTKGRTCRWPLFHDPTNSPEYFGTMIADPDATSLLPTLYWFVADPAAAETRAGTRASVFYVGMSPSSGLAYSADFYDNVFVRLRGVLSRNWPKKSLKFDFNQGYHFRFSPDQEPVEEFNLNSTSSDAAYIRQTLAWETYRDAGVPYCSSFPMRVQRNGAFYSVAIFVEQPDKRYLERQGLDPGGAFYKMKTFNALTSSTKNVQKQTRLEENNGDLQALIDGIHLSGKAQKIYLFDNVNIPAIINYQAVATIIHDRDQGHNNYYAYRDTEGTGEWTFLPWDKDLTFGLNYNEGLDLTVTADDDPQSHPLSGYKHNDLIDALYQIPGTREMFLRRLRTIMDELLQPPGTPIAERYYEQRIDALFTQMQPDVALDAAKWPALGPPQTFAHAVKSLRSDYLAVRRVHLYNTHGPDYGIIPDAQSLTATVQFGDIGFASSPKDAEQGRVRFQEYLRLVNPNRYAVDVSGWKITNAVEYTFQPGVVIPAGRTLYVSPDVVAFRGRASSPTGGEGRLVQGNYDGRLSNTGGTLRLYNADGMLVASKVFLDLSPFSGGVMLTALLLLVLSVTMHSALEAPTRVR